ncbi:hypothetical protein VJ923_08020 [Adlercreutzia sp. R25]|uniref:hypothetical protein n=1 Tax=Adlercreutzia shanghongiae TaxID=3111773 RepID=UPI002DBC1089|nr:hypothetical protein [Adlercreutzia sp. R25]MEC4273102.1 hypothetical protein [Adlercreutzia sp. R25]
MATKTFSGRVDEGALAFADALAQREYGLSFGQYCGTVLLDSIQTTGTMPSLVAPSSGKSDAAAFIKGFAARARHPEVGRLSDAEVRDLIAGRYE